MGFIAGLRSCWESPGSVSLVTHLIKQSFLPQNLLEMVERKSSCRLEFSLLGCEEPLCAFSLNKTGGDQSRKIPSWSWSIYCTPWASWQDGCHPDFKGEQYWGFPCKICLQFICLQLFAFLNTSIFKHLYSFILYYKPSDITLLATCHMMKKWTGMEKQAQKLHGFIKILPFWIISIWSKF